MYINPIEILGLSNAIDISSIDNETIKKEKRKLFAEIDLSDNGVLDYYGVQLTKGQCEKVIDELSNNDYKEYYLYLSNNKLLNIFLASGDIAIFKKFKQDSIFKLPEFIKFISPYFVPKFDKALLIAFENDDVVLTQAILKTSILIEQTDQNIAFKSISNNIQNKITEIDSITKDIENEVSEYDEDNIEEVVYLVKSYFPSNTINCLPLYFQSQILKIAKAINYLSNSIWDAFDTTQVPNDLTEYLLTLNIGGLDRPTFENNFKIINKRNNEKKEEEKYLPILKKYAESLIQIRTKIDDVKNKKITATNALIWIQSTVSISDLNILPSVFDEIKNQFALSIRAMSVEVWNTYFEIDISIDLINIASNIIGLKVETQEKLLGAKNHLAELKIKIDSTFALTQKTKTSSSSNEIKKATVSAFRYNNPGCLWIIFIIIMIIVIVWANNYKSPSYVSPTNSSESTQLNENTYDNNTTTSADNTSPIESQYLGNQLQNGESPFTGCFGKGVYDGNATLTIENGGETDAIVCLYSIVEGRTIRNEYVQKNSSFKMTSIGKGDYKIRVFSGNNWNPELENNCGTKGNFESDISFTEFDGVENFEDSEYGYTIATITLYSVAGGNASSSTIDPTQFFK